jgi:hypothetical protein
MRDFIQNFYDSAGYERWHDSHAVETGTDHIKLTINNEGFDHDWLLYLGASTKREESPDGPKAGYYGEGFKMAALCAVRDMKWGVEAASRNWLIKVIRAPEVIDGQKVDVLAYELRERDGGDADTYIKISSLKNGDKNYFDSAMTSFYYPQNPLLGEKIYENKNAAVYCRSKTPRSSYLFETRGLPGNGIIFARLQLLGSIDADLVFAFHDFTPESRDRRSLYKNDAMRAAFNAAAECDAGAALKLLNLLKNKWRAFPNNGFVFESWYPVIFKLCEIISQDKSAAVEFKRKNHNLLAKRNRHTLGKALIRPYSYSLELAKNLPERKFVSSAFVQLGVKYLDEALTANVRENFETKPDHIQKTRIEIMKEAFDKIIGPLLIDYSPPETFLAPVKTPLLIAEGKCAKYITNPEYLSKKTFRRSFFLYSVKMMRFYIKDNEAFKNCVLTEALRLLLKGSKQIAKYDEKWRLVKNEKFASGEKNGNVRQDRQSGQVQKFL